MYIAMNRFEVAVGREDEFEEVWRNRESYLDEVDGIRDFCLLRGAPGEESTHFLSYSRWESQAVFKAWTESEAFIKAHRQAKMPEGLVLGHPRFEGFVVVDLGS